MLEVSSGVLGNAYMFSYGFWLVAGWGREDIVGGLVFVVLMFIGAGVGLLFERPAAGGLLGWGLASWLWLT